MFDSVLDIVRLFAKSPRTGIENIIQAVEPRAEKVAREAAHRAATLVRTGDRKTMVAMLGATAAIGWLIAKSGSHAGKLIASDGNADKSSALSEDQAVNAARTRFAGAMIALQILSQLEREGTKVILKY